MNDTSMQLCQQFTDEYLKGKPKMFVADVGSYDVNGTYRPIIESLGHYYHGIDIDRGPNVDSVVLPNDFYYERTSDDLLIQSNLLGKFDVVISGQCLEHVFRPWQWIQQVASLGKPGAVYWITAPNTWAFHEFPVDCWRVWPDGLRTLYVDVKLIPLRCWFEGSYTMGIARKPFSYETVNWEDHEPKPPLVPFHNM